MTGQGPTGARTWRHPLSGLPKYYGIGLIVMIIGLLVSLTISEFVGLLLLVIGFTLGILGRIHNRKRLTRQSERKPESSFETSSAGSITGEIPKREAMMIRCRNCGTLFREDLIKCPNCGAGHS